MPKTKIYATSSGDRNAAILIETGTTVPYGHTEKAPPEPVDGYKVTWDENSNGWQQVEIPDQNGDIDPPV